MKRSGTEQQTTAGWPNSVIFILLLFIPMISAIAYGAVDAAAVSILSLFSAAMVLVWIAGSFRSGSFEISPDPIQLGLIGLIILGGIQMLPLTAADGASLLSIPASSALSYDPYATRLFIVKAIIFMIFFAAALTFLRGRERYVKTAAVIIIFGSLMSFFGILQRLADPDAIYGLRPTPHAIPFSSFVNQHHFASFMLMTTGVALGVVLGGALKKDKLIMVWAAIVVMTLGIIFTGSRGGMIGYFSMAAVSLSLAAVTRKKGTAYERDLLGGRGKLAVLTIGMTMVIAIIGIALYLGAGDSLFRGVGLGGEMADATNGRLHYWNIALKIFAEHPILGAGLDAYGTAFTKFDTDNGMYRLEYAHNEYLQILADGGIVGFLCVAAFLIFLFRSGLKLAGLNLAGRSNDRLVISIAAGAFAGCVGVIVHSFFDFPLRTTSNAFFFLILTTLVINANAFIKTKEP